MMNLLPCFINICARRKRNRFDVRKESREGFAGQSSQKLVGQQAVQRGLLNTFGVAMTCCGRPRDSPSVRDDVSNIMLDARAIGRDSVLTSRSILHREVFLPEAAPAPNPGFLSREAFR
ncbi:MAG: hypothetical protein ACR2LZ_02825 [Pyrinomonadaceae bacterium]